MINYSYLYASPRSQVVYLCRTSHGLQFSSSCFSCAFWVGRNLVRLFCISRKSFSPALFYIHTRKEKHRNQNLRYIKTFCEQRKNMKYPWRRKNWVGSLFLYFSLQILHTREPAGSARRCCQCCHAQKAEPNVGETPFLIPHVCNPLD